MGVRRIDASWTSETSGGWAGRWGARRRPSSKFCSIVESQRLGGIRWRTLGGYKRRFEVQDCLVILVAMGQASLTKQSREYVYEIKPDLSSAAE